MASCHLILVVILTFFSRNHALVPEINEAIFELRSGGNKDFQKISKDSSVLLEYRTVNASNEILELRNGLKVRGLKSRLGSFQSTCKTAKDCELSFSNPNADDYGNCDTDIDEKDRISKYDRNNTFDQPCIFPFKYKGITYQTCTFVRRYDSRSKAIDPDEPWCATEVDSNGEVKKGQWGVCQVNIASVTKTKSSCPIPPLSCGVPVRTRTTTQALKAITDKLKKKDDKASIFDADILQMPWMVTIGKYSGGKWEHRCAGSLLTKNHVLTAARCFDYFGPDHAGEGAYVMRFGATNILEEGEETINRGIDQFKVHPKYEKGKPYFDVGLAITSYDIDFTAYIRPICLPTESSDNADLGLGDSVTLSGWGKDYDKTGRNFNINRKIQLSEANIMAKKTCDDRFSEDNFIDKDIPVWKRNQQLPNGMQNDITCVSDEFGDKSGTCDGDTGSPVIRRISGSETAREAYYEQQYLVTTGIDCRLKTKIYVRLSHRQILSWIQQETENVPLVMVVGGYISGVANGDVELIDPNDYRDTKICKRKIAPVPINIAGHVGKYTNGAPRVCGGKNDAGRVVKNCYEYNIVNNEWEEMKSLKKKRRDSIGLLNDDDELWILGGTDESKIGTSEKAHKKNERFEYKSSNRRKGKWKTSSKFPPDYKNSGITGPCGVNLNRTHVLIVGGRYGIFKLDDQAEGLVGVSVGDSGSFTPTSSETKYTGDFTNNRTFIYDSSSWKEMKNIPLQLENAACVAFDLTDVPQEELSLFGLRQGGKDSAENCNGRCQRVIVAGGQTCTSIPCKNPIESKKAFIYNPYEDEWKAAADLPQKLRNARMELLDGVPTVFGGIENDIRSNKLYQYNHTKDEWREHPQNLRLDQGRDAAAVFRVPKFLFEHLPCEDDSVDEFDEYYDIETPIVSGGSDYDYYDVGIKIVGGKKTCVTKRRNGNPPKPCIFPFTATNGITYSSCGNVGGKYYCATEVDNNGIWKAGSECEPSSCCMSKASEKEPPKPCIFPFTFSGKKYSACGNYKGRSFCATDVDGNGNLLKASDCDDICPKE